MLTKNFKQLQEEVAYHVKADRVAPGSYWTCFIGCLAHGENNPDYIENRYGIPLMVTRIAESIFEGLPADEAIGFFAALPSAVGFDGKDLSRVGWKFLASELRSLPPVDPEIQAVIDSVIAGMDLLADGGHWPEKDALTAAGDISKAANWDAMASRYLALDWHIVKAANWTWRAAKAANWAAKTANWAARSFMDKLAACAAKAAESAAVDTAARRRQRDLLLKLIKEAPVNSLI
jgi:hypothetical protein